MRSATRLFPRKSVVDKTKCNEVLERIPDIIAALGYAETIQFFAHCIAVVEQRQERHFSEPLKP